MEAWSDRFTGLEEKYYSLAEELYRRLEDIQKEVNVKFIEAGADAEKAVKVVNKDLNARIRECEEGLFNIRLDLRSFAATATSPTSATLALDPEERKSELFDPRPEPVGRSNGLLERLEMRVAAMERRFDKKKARTQPSFTRNSDDEEASRKEIMDMVEKKHQAALKDVQTYMETLTESLRQSVPAPSSPSRPSANSLTVKDLEPLQNRLRALESTVPSRHNTVPSNPARDDLQQLQAQIHAIRMEGQSKREKATADLGKEIGAVREELMSVEQAVLRIRDSMELMRKEQEISSKKQLLGSTDPSAPSISSSQGITSKQLLADVSILFATERSRGFSQPPVPLQSNGLEQVQVLESGLAALRHEMEKIKGGMAARDREIDEMNEHFDRMDRMFSGAVQRVQTEVNKKMDSIEELLDRPADNPEASKNLSTLRSVIIKLQRDLRTLSGSVKQQTTPLPLEDLIPQSKE